MIYIILFNEHVFHYIPIKHQHKINAVKWINDVYCDVFQKYKKYKAEIDCPKVAHILNIIKWDKYIL